MGTDALVGSGVYQEALKRQGLEIVVTDSYNQQKIESALLHPDYGIKAHCNPVSDRARRLITEGIEYIIAEQCQAIVLGCSEISMIVTEPEIEGALMIDLTSILARALIRATDVNKLRDLRCP